jgi:hypothetical protein
MARELSALCQGRKKRVIENGSCVTYDLLERTGSLAGMLAFGGAVVLFDSYEYLGFPAVKLNLTLGIRSDSILKP